MDELQRLEPFADDPGFQKAFLEAKRQNKLRLAKIIRKVTGETVDPDSLFDVQVKRLHEYKRQLLNALHIITLYHRLKADPSLNMVPRTFLFGAKAEQLKQRYYLRLITPQEAAQEQIWLEALQPIGEKGYNPDAKIRQA